VSSKKLKMVPDFQAKNHNRHLDAGMLPVSEKSSTNPWTACMKLRSKKFAAAGFLPKYNCNKSYVGIKSPAMNRNKLPSEYDG